MTITSVKYQKNENDENGAVQITYSNGEVWSAPMIGSNRHWQEVQEWVLHKRQRPEENKERLKTSKEN